MKMKKLLATLALVMFHALAKAQDADPALTATLARLHAQSSLPGFAVAIVSPAGTLYQRGFGKADVAAGTPYTEHTLQNLGSVSKTVVGVALLKAVELGYFTLDTEIRALLPFAVGNPRSAPITIRQLATHTSGIVDDDAIYGHSYFLTAHADRGSPLYAQFRRDYTARRKDLSLGSFLRNYLAPTGRYYKKTNFSREAPGTAYAYSNIGAALAAYLIELKSGNSFDAFTQQHIFVPLGMRDTSWSVDADRFARHARVYNRRALPYPHYALITYPDGGLTSSAADMALYLAAMLRGFGGEAGVLDKNGFRELFAAQFAAGNAPAGSPKGEPNSGIFWRIKRNGQIGHTGSDPGITAYLFFDPATRLGRILLANTEFSDAHGQDDPRVIAQFHAVWNALGESAVAASAGVSQSGQSNTALQ